VYAVFSADQILAALNHDPTLNPEADALLNLSPSSFRQCQPAPPQTAKDAAGAAAYFVCDVRGMAAVLRGRPFFSAATFTVCSCGAQMSGRMQQHAQLCMQTIYLVSYEASPAVCHGSSAAHLAY
jgi:hypothetical protein